MSDHRETNVRLPLCAAEALARIGARRGASRDETVRQILDEHIAEQQAREPEDWLTHISTVLRYPAPPRSRLDERTDLPLRLRLLPGVAERAAAMALRLPGQWQNAYRDYQARPLTDAVITAIAVREPFTDEFLGDLLPLLRHGAALGLWQLAVAVTSTAAERAILNRAEDIRSQIGPSPDLPPADERLLLVAEALEVVAWHSPARFTVAAALAREFLSGDDAQATEQMLYDQRTEWNELRLDLLHSSPQRKAVYFREIPDSHDWSGRGGTAVWRAERKVEIQDFEDWLVSSSDASEPRERVVSPPGWLVRVPAGWEACVLPHGRDLPARFAQWVEAGRVMVFPVQGKQVVWPLMQGHTSPVPGVEPLVAIARGLRPEKVVEFVEAILVEWEPPRNDGTGNETYDEDSGEEGLYEDADYEVYDEFFDPAAEVVLEPEPAPEMPSLLLPVDKAFDFGFVTAEERRRAMADARALTVDLPDWPEREVLPPMLTADPRFRLFVTRRRNRRTAKPMWLWPGGSVAAEVGTTTSAEVIGWLADCADRTAQWERHRAMQKAWHDGFDHHPDSFWHPLAPRDEPV